MQELTTIDTTVKLSFRAEISLKSVSVGTIVVSPGNITSLSFIFSLDSVHWAHQLPSFSRKMKERTFLVETVPFLHAEVPLISLRENIDWRQRHLCLVTHCEPSSVLQIHDLVANPRRVQQISELKLGHHTWGVNLKRKDQPWLWFVLLPCAHQKYILRWTRVLIRVFNNWIHIYDLGNVT